PCLRARGPRPFRAARPHQHRRRREARPRPPRRGPTKGRQAGRSLPVDRRHRRAPRRGNRSRRRRRALVEWRLRRHPPQALGGSASSMKPDTSQAKELAELALRVAREGAQLASQGFRSRSTVVSRKGAIDLVTEYDTRGEALIVERLT